MSLEKFAANCLLIHKARKSDAYLKRLRFRIALNAVLLWALLIYKFEAGISTIYLVLIVALGWLILELAFRIYICYFIKEGDSKSIDASSPD